MQQVAVVVGTRPEAIKMAPIYRELSRSSILQPILLSTGQHREMLKQALDVFNLTPDFDLGLMKPNQSLAQLTSQTLSAVSQFLQQNPMDAVLVQGDTTSVLGSALAATFAKIPIGHVEAGLRTYDMEHPFPEEINRRLVSPLARWSFVPTQLNRQNLLQEKIDPAGIHVTGNSVIDALLWTRESLASQTQSVQERAVQLGLPPEFSSEFLESETGRFILVTGHRRESFGSGFESICRGLLEIARRFSDVGIVYPVHLNPQVQEPVKRLLRGNPQIALIQPVSYQDFIWLMDRSYFLLSDSGGVQEEAPSLGKPVLVMRSTTERPEGVEAGTCRLVGTDQHVMVSEAARLLEDREEYLQRSALKNPYGDGTAAQCIRRILEEDLQKAS
ncbi:non-hydrolyzing UDP-N-acetylglucosamine 2-epimerase [Aureliella helgolandensis]|uniref:UDP-N-acetylglucosamine 2-epimerase (non-hydrolyzing) n=1 Tax=Aureliella helgolandensis TaxID=2527968 RepID=A0A518GBY0_9BACT|nr:UDP-N-acetylglucosamine 2-epimerase (non-hydrolyzing) [Aureliella helgolandensis]QDV26122.1 UDP-N-acetylglucosamine 2-epimerase [Aureliella helgolandensis]